MISATIRGSIGRGQMRMSIPSKMKNACQRVKATVTGTYSLIHPKKDSPTFFIPLTRACACGKIK
jgi:hypothetical protein